MIECDQITFYQILFFFLGFHTCSAFGLPRSVLSRRRWTLLSRALCLGSTDTQSTADMGRPPRGTSAHFFCTVSAAGAVCLPVLCVCDVCVCAGYVSQHTALVLTSHHLVPTLQHLVLSRTISHQSPQHLVPISQHLAPISQHLVPLVPISHDLTYRPSAIWTDLAAPSRTDLVAPSCTDLAAPSRADLVALSCTDLAASRTGLAVLSRADLAARTDLVAPSRAGLTAPSRATISHCPRSTVAWQWAVHGACWRPHPWTFLPHVPYRLATCMFQN